MMFSAQPVSTSLEALAADFFQRSVGNWRSERRYYKLKNGETQEIVSSLTICFLWADNPVLLQLAQAHHLPKDVRLTCGVIATWDSHEAASGKPQSAGSTTFGLRGNLLYRDRGFATPQPVTAEFDLPDPNTMRLRTEYGGSAFEEEIRLIGVNYRTRQTIISRSGEEQMIGQYLERRLA